MSTELRARVAQFLEWSAVVGYSPDTIRIRETTLGWFLDWCDERSVCAPRELTRTVIDRYQHHLYHYRKANGEPLTYGSQINRLNPLRAFCKWLVRENLLLYDPAAALVLVRPPKRLPHVPTLLQVETILNGADVSTAEGIRDRAIMEVFYSSGLRRAELMRLKRHEVDLSSRVVWIRQGKGRKDRVVPVGERACMWVRKYVNDVRPHSVNGIDSETLFLMDTNRSFTKDALTRCLANYVRAAGLAHGACHLLRHAMATHMLENGADVRYIQAILGHSDLETTAVYTHVSIAKLKEVHAATHPARVLRTAQTDVNVAARSADADVLLSSLVADVDDDDAD
jgi:integrase/recombinase XerD